MYNIYAPYSLISMTTLIKALYDPAIDTTHSMILLLLLPLLVFILLLICFQPTIIEMSGSQRLQLPPGSMGWPYIGETLRLYTQNPNSFFTARLKRYGDIFKTHILGCPCVMISSPEAARSVLVTRAHLFKPTYPPSKEKLIGPQALFFHQGHYHSNLKALVQSSFHPNRIRDSVPEIQRTVNTFLRNWGHCTNINTLQEMKRYAFEVAMISAFGSSTKQEVEVEGIKNLYLQLEKGYNSMPLDLPGTPFRRAMKARKLLDETLMTLIQKRRETGDNSGLLGVLLAAADNNNNLSDAQIADNIIGVIFAAHDTTASILTWILKYLHDNKHLLDAVKKEQEDIRCKIHEENRELTWNDTRSMPFTSRVIKETLRSASILSFTFREAVQDIEFEGYFIPKGWKVLPLFRTIHHSPDFYPHPEKFDPSRFEGPPKPHTFIPFGKGAHSCPGSELAKLEMLILLHHLTISYRWQVVGDNEGIQYGPFPVPKHGLPIRLVPIGLPILKTENF